MLSIILTADVPGRTYICELCDERFTSAMEQPRAWIDDDYVGIVCFDCHDAGPEELLQRMRRALDEVTDRAEKLQRAEHWASAEAPAAKRKAFRLVV